MYSSKLAALFLVLCLFALSVGCKAEVGSKAWCEEMKQKPKADWTANEAVDYAKHCIFEKKE